MNREHIKELLPIIQAYANGAEIQLNREGKWKDIVNPAFSSEPSKYRIKPEPRVVYPVEIEGNEIWSTQRRNPNAIKFREVTDDE